MSKKEFLHELYGSHTKDLRSLNDEIEGFICPICLSAFTRGDIENGFLTDGHVWVKDIRKGSDVASSQRVLLCSICNHTSGSKGDKQMQLAEKIKDLEKSGKLLGERQVEFVKGPDTKPISVQASVILKEDNIIKIEGNWNRTNPSERKRFENWIKMGEKSSIVVHPHKEIRQGLPRSGWITSSYLFSFYRLGYRYILHPSLDPVRKFILSSFENDVFDLYKDLESEFFHVKQYTDIEFKDPILRLIVPLDEEKIIHLQVNFLQYQIHLPFHIVPNIISSLIELSKPDFFSQLPEIKKQTDHVYFNIDCCKLDNHDCVFDYLMGKAFD